VFQLNTDVSNLFFTITNLLNDDLYLMTLTFMGPCIVNVIYQVYQQDATLYKFDKI